MYMLDRLRVRPILISELGYTPLKADFFIDNYPLLNDQFKEPVEAWLLDRSISDFDVEGISIRQVIAMQDCNFLNAVRELNYLFLPSLSNDVREAIKISLSTPFRRA
jgi:hypothetical protein